jgi:hypothetical protein
MTSCDLCRAVHDLDDREFASRYPGSLSRVTTMSPGIAVMPSVGSLGRIHALILPIDHARSTAGAPAGVARALWDVAQALREDLSDVGFGSVVFEHGLPPHGGTGCGVDHAHIHVVAITPDTPLRSPRGPWANHRSGPPHLCIDPDREHLVLGLPSGEWLTRYEDNVQSQFLRRWLATELGYETWDWRQVD